MSFVRDAKKQGYKVTLLYFWLTSPEFAIERVAKRVEKGGHDIPTDVIVRRYYRGIHNLINLYIPICDNWYVVDNRDSVRGIARKKEGFYEMIINNDIWVTILRQSEHNGR